MVLAGAAASVAPASLARVHLRAIRIRGFKSFPEPVEVLADVGLGGSHGSVISQGKVEEILASKPEERRILIEDAAGLGKFKRRRHRAELKLARVQIQVERARDLEAEVKARLRPLALQATAAERAERLAEQIAGLRARVAELDLAAIAERRGEAEGRQTAAALARRAPD